ncbi:hypothetical protein AVEN_258866-1 [Araneus ventricosus]|uniref:Uncharacterized protein n=1 Tax=Araneus ventricosus TaxID=182803 RepID=A0A4Y2QSX3_ARAVE|nr:hypothetical protein AVEN_258866-1 [Araneus ventricosus]
MNRLSRSFTATPGHSDPLLHLLFPNLQNAIPCLLRFPLERGRLNPLIRIYSGRISTFMAWSLNGAVRYPNFSSALRVFTLTTDFGVDRANLNRVERS